MDTLNTEDLFDASWLDDIMLDFPELSPEDKAMAEVLVERVKAGMAEKAQLRASQRKKEDPESGPSKKISMRLPRWLLALLKEQATLTGVPYQTLIKMMLYKAVTQ